MSDNTQDRYEKGRKLRERTTRAILGAAMVLRLILGVSLALWLLSPSS